MKYWIFRMLTIRYSEVIGRSIYESFQAKRINRIDIVNSPESFIYNLMHLNVYS